MHDQTGGTFAVPSWPRLTNQMWVILKAFLGHCIQPLSKENKVGYTLESSPKIPLPNILVRLYFLIYCSLTNVIFCGRKHVKRAEIIEEM